jgi:hypothetical protein
MSRSGYSDDLSARELALYRGNVDRAIRGRRGQALLRDIAAYMDAMPVKRLEAGVLVSETGCCALGAAALYRGMDVSYVDAYDTAEVAEVFMISWPLAAEIMFINDEDWGHDPTPEQRWTYVRE